MNCEISGNIPKNRWQPTKIFVHEPMTFSSESWHLDITDLCTGLDGGEGLTERSRSRETGRRGPGFIPSQPNPPHMYSGVIAVFVGLDRLTSHHSMYMVYTCLYVPTNSP